MNITLIKGFCLAILAWLGVTVTTPNGWLYIHIAEGSVGWYLMYAVCLLSLVSGLHKIYTFLRRRTAAYLRCIRLRNIIKIRQDRRHSNIEN